MADRPRAEPSRRSVAAPLVKAGHPGEYVAWYCTNCGTIYKTKDDAERCAVKNGEARFAKGRKGMDDTKPCTEWSCEECGKPAFAPYQWYCGSCLSKHRTARDQEKLAKAEKVVKAEDYPDDQGVVWDDEWYCCLEDFVEWCHNMDVDVPPRVWATSPSRFHVNADEILEAEFENWAEGCDDIGMDSIVGVDDFKAFVAAFNERQTATLWWECDTAVDLTGVSWESMSGLDEEDD